MTLRLATTHTEYAGVFGARAIRMMDAGFAPYEHARLAFSFAIRALPDDDAPDALYDVRRQLERKACR